MAVSHHRRTAVGTAAIVLTAALAACGMGGGTAEQTGSNQLTVWFPGTDPAESALVEDTLVPAFEEQTGAEVEVTYVDYADLSNKLTAAFAAGTAPDVFGHGPAAVADFVANDRLEPLQDYVDGLDQADLDDLATALPGGQVDGEQYLVPLQMQGWALAYDRSDFAAAGLDPDSPPTTWEAVREAAAQLTVRDGDGAITRSGLLLATDPIGRQQSFATLIAGAGGELVDTADLTAAFDTPDGREALDYYVDLFNGDDAVATGLGVTYSANPTAQQPLVTDTASITLLSANAISKLATEAPDLDLGIMQPLRFEDSDTPAAFGGAGPGLMINADSHVKDLAWQFIEYMTGADVNQEYVASFGGIPVRASAADSEYVAESPVLPAFLDAAPYFVPNPNVPGWVQARDTMDAHLEEALNQKAPTDEVLADMAAAVDDVLESSR
jgi:multiple sugar transport system substrate-binding protein